MAGLFALLFGGYFLGKNVVQDANERYETNLSKNLAKNTGEQLYIDFWNKLHWTETGEEVRLCGAKGNHSTGYKIVGVQSGTVYYHEKSDAELLEDKFKAGLEYCKANGIKYLPWKFDTDFGFVKFASSGIEIDTGKRYVFLNYSDTYYMVYLEDYPHSIYCPYRGSRRTYDAVHDETRESYEKPGFTVAQLRHRTYGGEDYDYYTKIYEVSKEEYLERTTPIKGYECRIEHEIPKYGWK